MICTKDENNVHIQGTCSLSAYHVSLINSSPPKKITNNPHQQPTYMYGPIRNIFYIRQADELQSMYAIAGRAKTITNTPHQHQHTSHKYFPDNQMNFNLCIPLPGNLLSVQFTPLVSRAMVKFHTRKHLIVLAPFWTGASFGSLEENQLKGRTTSPDPPTPRDGPGINGFTKLTPTYSAMNDF